MNLFYKIARKAFIICRNTIKFQKINEDILLNNQINLYDKYNLNRFHGLQKLNIICQDIF